MRFLEIKELIDKGEYTQALKVIDQHEADEEFLEREIHKSLILTYMGKFQEALKLAERIITKCREEEDYIHLVGGLYAKSNVLYRLSNYDDALEILNEGENLLKIPKSEMEKYWQGQLLNRKGSIHWVKGSNDQALGYYKLSLQIFEELGYENDMADMLNNIGAVFWNKGELILASSYWNQALDIKEKIGNKQSIAMTLGNLAVIYTQKGELDKALEYNQRAFEINKEIGNEQDVALILNNFGAIFYNKGDITKSISYQKEALEIKEKIGNIPEIAQSVYNLFESYLQIDDLETAQHYANRLVGFSVVADSDLIKLMVKLTSALLLKQEKRLRKKAKAQDLFEEIISEEVIDFNLTQVATVNLCDLLIEELHFYDNEEIFFELKRLIDDLLNTAQQQQSHLLYIEALIFQAKLHVIETNVTDADLVLEQASYMANQKGLNYLIQKIKIEREKLRNEIKKWTNLAEKGASIQERIGESGVKDYLSQMDRFYE